MFIKCGVHAFCFLFDGLADCFPEEVDGDSTTVLLFLFSPFEAVEAGFEEGEAGFEEDEVVFESDEVVFEEEEEASGFSTLPEALCP